MVDPGLVKHMVADGFSPEAAADHVEAVTAAMVAQIRAGKMVVIDGIGRLKLGREKAVDVGFPPNMVRKQQKIELKSDIVVKGEPYPHPHGPRKPGTNQRAKFRG